MAKFTKYLWRVMKWIGWGSLFVLILSSFSDRVPPSFAIVFPYLGLFFPFILGFNVCLLLFWLFFRQWKQVLIVLGVFLICSGAIRTYFPYNARSKEVPENALKVLTYNVMRFDYLRKPTPGHPNPVLQYIVEQDPDIICIQEYGASLKNDKEINQSEIIKTLHKTPYYHVEHLRFPYSGQSFGLAIFSKYPIRTTRKLPYDSEYNGSIMAEIDVNGKVITVINNHLESNKISADERSNYYDLTKDINKEKLTAFLKTAHHRLTPAFLQREEQANIVAQTIQDSVNPYIIVCGDFNDTPISYAHHKIKGTLLKNAFVESGRGMGITYNRNRFLFRIDNILHSENMKAYNCTIGKLKNSDHYPVVTYLELK